MNRPILRATERLRAYARALHSAGLITTETARIFNEELSAIEINLGPEEDLPQVNDKSLKRNIEEDLPQVNDRSLKRNSD